MNRWAGVSSLMATAAVWTVFSAESGKLPVEAAGQNAAAAQPAAAARAQGPPDAAKFLTQPLMTNIFTADPSAHVFNGKVFIYPFRCGRCFSRFRLMQWGRRYVRRTCS